MDTHIIYPKNILNKMDLLSHYFEVALKDTQKEIISKEIYSLRVLVMGILGEERPLKLTKG
jgi:hypothetical protein